MREIKFRAWDSSFPKMRYFSLIDLIKGYALDSACHDDLCGDEEDMPLMQFTGLLDKNGKEIYEDDVVQVWNGSEGTVLTKVDWYEFGWRLMRICDKETWYIKYWEHDDAGIEIIGNIYENPELLEPKP